MFFPVSFHFVSFFDVTISFSDENVINVDRNKQKSELEKMFEREEIIEAAVFVCERERESDMVSQLAMKRMNDD